MSKRKPASKASRSRAASNRKPARRRVPVDPTGHMMLFDPRTGEATFATGTVTITPARREQIKAREAVRTRGVRERYRARQEAFRAQLARRPAEMQRDGYRLPAHVAGFLLRLRRDPLAWQDQREHITVAEAREMIDAAYAEGCRQGFIEGRVLDLEPKQQRSAKANAAKRKKPREHNGMRYTLDQRDAAIVAEHAALRPMVGATEAAYRLAEKYDLSDKMVRIIVSKAKRAAK